MLNKYTNIQVPKPELLCKVIVVLATNNAVPIASVYLTFTTRHLIMIGGSILITQYKHNLVYVCHTTNRITTNLFSTLAFSEGRGASSTKAHRAY